MAYLAKISSEDSRSRRAQSSVYRRGHPIHRSSRYLPSTSGNRPQPYQGLNGGLYGSDSDKPLSANIHKLVQFEMFIQNKSTNPPSRIHTITRLKMPTEHSPHTQAQQQDMPISDVRLLENFLPNLTDLWKDGALTAETQVICAQAGLEFIPDTLDKNIAELGIQFELGKSHEHAQRKLEKYKGFECTTTFYRRDDSERGYEMIEQSRKSIDYDRVYKRLGNVQFGSGFWAKEFMKVGKQLREANRARRKAVEAGLPQNGVESDYYLRSARNHEQQAKDIVAGLSSLQEITGIPKSPNESAKPVRLLVVCWKFSQAAAGREGEVTWRNVMLPPLTDGAVKPPGTSQAPPAPTKNEYDPNPPLALNHLSCHDGIPTLQQSSLFEQHHNLDFNLSALQNLQLPTTIGVSTHGLPISLYPSNDIDFTGGHIQLCMNGAPPAYHNIDPGTSGFNSNYPIEATAGNEVDSHAGSQHAHYDFDHAQSGNSQQSQWPPAQTRHPYHAAPYFDPSQFHHRVSASGNSHHYTDPSTAGASHGSFSIESGESHLPQTYAANTENRDLNVGVSVRNMRSVGEGHADGGAEHEDAIMPSVEFGMHLGNGGFGGQAFDGSVTR
jgi:hypothetical protein